MKRLLISLALLYAAAFAQEEAEEEAEKFAVYVSGSSEAGVNKSLGNKLIAAIARRGHDEIEDSEAFYRELSKSKETGISQAVQAAKKRGADFVCVVVITEVLGANSISARIVETEDSYISASVSVDHSLSSLDDLTKASDEIMAQLFQLAPAAKAAIAPAAAAPQKQAPPPQKCKSKYNINELLAQIQYGFPAQLKDCGSSFAKDLAKSKVPFSKTPAPEPKSYMTTCAIDGIKGRLPEGFPGADKVIGDVQKFIKSILGAAMAGGSINPAKLSSAIAGMNVGKLLDGIENMAAENPSCFVDEPYEYVAPVAAKPLEEGKKGSGKAAGLFIGISILLIIISSIIL